MRYGMEWSAMDGWLCISKHCAGVHGARILGKPKPEDALIWGNNRIGQSVISHTGGVEER